jgi:hypothetical protein
VRFALGRVLIKARVVTADHVRFGSLGGLKSDIRQRSGKCHVWTAPAVQGESDIQRGVRVQPCIRPLNAAALAAGPDVIR